MNAISTVCRWSRVIGLCTLLSQDACLVAASGDIAFAVALQQVRRSHNQEVVTIDGQQVPYCLPFSNTIRLTDILFLRIDQQSANSKQVLLIHAHKEKSHKEILVRIYQSQDKSTFRFALPKSISPEHYSSRKCLAVGCEDAVSEVFLVNAEW